MSEANDSMPGMPTLDQIRKAIGLYLDQAYSGAVPEAVRHLVPPKGSDPAQWLGGEDVERTPADAPLGQVRSFALRLGNSQYRHMKLRLSRPPKHSEFLFTVDSHDGFLRAPAGSPDHEALAALKRHNAAVAAAVVAAWDAADLPTERDYLRWKIRQARGQRSE